MPSNDIPIADLLAIAKTGSLDGRRVTAAVATELIRSEAAARRAAAAGLVGVLPREVAEKLAAVPDQTASTSDAVSLVRSAIADAGLEPQVAGRLIEKLDRVAPEVTGNMRPDVRPDGRPDPAALEPPETMILLEKARLAEAVTAAGIKGKVARAVLDRLSGPDDLSDQTIGTMVIEGKLDEKQGQKLGRTIGLARLLGDNSLAAAKLVDMRFSPTGRPVEDLADLIDVPVEELAKGIAAADPALKASAREQALNVQGHLAEMFPVRGLTAQLRAVAPVGADTDFRRLARGLKGRQGVWDGTESDPTFDARTAKALTEARMLDRAWTGLGIGKDLLDPGAKGAAAEIGKRIEAASTFLRRNEDKALFDLDLSPDSDDIRELDFSGTPDAMREGLIAHLKARSRAYHLAGNTAGTARMMAAGIHTMQGVIDEGIEGLIAKAGLDPDQAERVLAAAHDRRTEVVATVVGLADELRWDLAGKVEKVPPFVSLMPDVTDGLRALPGYEEIFGNQTYCDCEHCGSILSPAAYFVDLMKWIDEKVTAKVFGGQTSDHALRLSVRRPDLWKLPLTCENTETLIPTLEVINEVLENALAKAVDPGISTGDRAAVTRKVYAEVLPAFARSFVSPFDLRTARADRVLTSFDTDRLAVTDHVRPGAPALDLASAGLGIPLSAATEIVTERATWPVLEAVFSHPFPRSGNSVTALDVQDLITGMGTTRAVLGALAESRFVTNGGTIGVTIASGKRDAQSVQNDIERISGLTHVALDRMARLFRLSQRVDWTIPAIDLVIERNGRSLTPEVLLSIVRLDRMRKRFGLTVESVLGLAGAIPETALSDSGESLMDRLFNLSLGGRTSPQLPSGTVRFVHPSFRSSAALPEAGPTAEHFLVQRLRYGLGTDDATLVALLTALAPALGFDPLAPNEASRGFALTAQNLSLVWRHATLAAAFGLVPGQLTLAARIATGQPALTTLAGVEATVNLLDTLRRHGIMIESLGAAMGLLADPVAAGVFLDAGGVATEMVAAIAAGDSRRFAPTVFAFVPGVSEDQSRAIVAANIGLFDPLPNDMLKLKPNVALNPALSAPAGGFPLGVTVAALQAELNARNLRSIVPAEAAARLGLSEPGLAALATLAGADLSSAAALAAFDGGSAQALTQALAALARPHAILDEVRDDTAAVSYLHGNRTRVGLPALGVPALSFDQAMTLLGFRRLHAEAVRAAGPAGDGGTRLAAVLTAHSAANGFAAATAADLALVTGAEVTEVRQLAAGVAVPANPVLGLLRLRAAATFAKDHAVPVDALILAASSDPVAQGQGGESLVSALRRKLGDDKSFAQVMDGHEDFLRGKRRDALTDHAIRRSAGRFTDRSDLYDYYLIDPSMEGCARTSRLVSAIGAVQTYVHRILLNLEQDRRDANAANHVHVSPTLIPGEEWEWRRNYRVWEANRKVFLWPENYMFEALRDNKTPAFQKLEKELLQQEVNEQTVLDAYARYLADFEAEAGLQIGGAFHEYMEEDQRDVLHVFGFTPDDPPAWYYWKIENLHYSRLRKDRRISYSNRTKLGVAIGAREVSPFIYLNRLHLFWVEITTQPENEVEDGENKFRGYRHTIGLRYSALRLDGSWTPPQSLALPAGSQLLAGGVLRDALTMRDINNFSNIAPAHAPTFNQHTVYSEGYTLTAPAWRRFYPAYLNGRLVGSLGARHVQLELDLFQRRAQSMSNFTYLVAHTSWRNNRMGFHVAETDSASPIYHQAMNYGGLFALATPRALIDFGKSRNTVQENIVSRGAINQQVDPFTRALNLAPDQLGGSIAVLADPQARLIVPESNWAQAEMIFQKDSDALFLGRDYDVDMPYQGRRIGTTLVGDLSWTLFYGGVATLLDKRTQRTLRERAHLIASQNGRTQLIGTTSGMDFTGPLGTYYREVFLHIPMLIAEHLNAKGNHAAAQGWYATIFDPTADFDPGVSLAGMTKAERLQAERDRVWQFVEFHGKAPPTLRAILTDDAAQDAYRRDPFNPYAIARLRISAFQKNAVMRYVQNLIDWADSLFRQFTMESVDEARVLYYMAEQILGPRPTDAGPCGEGGIIPRDFATISGVMEAGQDFLIEVETWTMAMRRKRAPTKKKMRRYVACSAASIVLAESRNTKLQTVRFGAAPGADAREKAGGDLIEAEVRTYSELMLKDDVTALARDVSASPDLAGAVYQVKVQGHAGSQGAAGRQLDWAKSVTLAERYGKVTTGSQGQNWKNIGKMRPDKIGYELVRQISPVFCVPRNKDLLALWDRVEDRLFKIHHCRNIDGERVDLALFAPEIDPMALVRAKAAGLSLSDVLGAGSGALPPYRFSYLIAKAREYASQAQGFASRLQGAIERRDGEELALLRQSQGADMLALVTRTREKELALAQTALSELERRQAAVTYRRGYTQGLVDEDLNLLERAQQIMMHSSSVSHGAAALLAGTGGVLHLIPQLGSPFAMKYGGQELGSSAARWSKVFSDTAKLLDIGGKSVALEAGFERRRAGWKHQVKLDDGELKQIEKQVAAARIRVEIAERALVQHQRSIEDAEEVLTLMQTRFSNLDLFAWLAGELQRLARQSFNAAMSMARLAQAAYQFERPDDTAALLQPTYWDASRAGLLAAERLSADLVEMEKRFLEGNFRRPEISQPFSLMQIDPGALLRLRQTGEAGFTIPEAAFDLLYPGHYRRRIRSVRLTLACVTGPFVNIPVTLTLRGAKIRMNPSLDGAAGLVATPLRHTVQIATSTAQNDGGMFDFSFADARYLPFEGAGAVASEWRIALPKTFRPFNYDTISDLVLHVSYQAETDGALRDRVETDDTAQTGALAKALRDNPMPRLLGLRQEFGSVFHQLTTLPLGIAADLVLDSRALPQPLRGRPVTVTRALLLVKVKAGIVPGSFAVVLNGQNLGGFTAVPEFPNYVVKACEAALGANPVKTHQIAIADAGGLAAPAGAVGPLAEGALEDMALYLEVRL